MITTFLVDDEDHNRNVLRTVLGNHFPALKIIGEAQNAEEAFLKINELKPQLVFLDIKMPRKSGFELLRMFPEINFETIFVSAYDKYAIKAFEFNALGYILKPVDVVKLGRAVKHTVERIQANEKNDLVFHFVKTLSDTNDLVNKLSLHHNGKVVFVPIKDIVCIEAKEENLTITLRSKDHYYSSKRLTAFETLLDEAENFMRISKSVIINTDHIKSYSKGEICIIDMITGETFEVSRRRKADILKKLKAV